VFCIEIVTYDVVVVEGGETFDESGWRDRMVGWTVNSCESDRDIIKYQRY